MPLFPLRFKLVPLISIVGASILAFVLPLALILSPLTLKVPNLIRPVVPDISVVVPEMSI